MLSGRYSQLRCMVYHLRIIQSFVHFTEHSFEHITLQYVHKWSTLPALFQLIWMSGSQRLTLPSSYFISSLAAPITWTTKQRYSASVPSWSLPAEHTSSPSPPLLTCGRNPTIAYSTYQSLPPISSISFINFFTSSKLRVRAVKAVFRRERICRRRTSSRDAESPMTREWYLLKRSLAAVRKALWSSRTLRKCAKIINLWAFLY